MSQSSRRSRSNRPPKSKQQELTEDLPELEPIAEDLPTLELVAGETKPDSPVTIACSAATEPGFDAVLEVTVPAMEKKAVADAAGPVLRRAATKHQTELRHRRVLVRFSGEGLIGSAVKDLVAATLRDAKVLLGVVRRGYGDETVHQGAMPKVELARQAAGLAIAVEVRGAVEPEDLPAALRPELGALAAECRDRTVAFTFAATAPDAATRDLLRSELKKAGARRVTIGGTVLFDRELEACAQVATADDTIELRLDDRAGEARLCEALATVLHGIDCGGRRVVVLCGSTTLTPAVVDCILEHCTPSGPQSLVRPRGADEPDVLWPRLLEVSKRDGQALLSVRLGQRSRDALLAAFTRELAAHAGKIAGADVTVDWPAMFVLEPEIERVFLQALLAHGPRSIACSFGGKDREQFLPEPLRVEAGAAGAVLYLDADAGKPPDVARAVERRVHRAAAELRGKSVRVEVAGDSAPSRTLLRTLITAIQAAGAARLEIDDHGKADVLFPALLTVTPRGDAVHVSAAAAGRDAAQIELALQRELDCAALPAKAVVVVAPDAAGVRPLADRVVAAFVARGAARVLLGDAAPVQVHPPLFRAPERAGSELRVRAAPGDDDAMTRAQVARELPGLLAAAGDLSTVTLTLTWPGAAAGVGPVAAVAEALRARNPKCLLLDPGRGKPVQLHPEIVPEYVRVLGRRDGAVPPLAMLGIDQAGGRDLGRVEAQLGAVADLLPGRRVLVVVRAADRDVPGKDDSELLQLVRRIVDAQAAATLVYRGVDAARRPFFEVVQSRLEGLAVGARMADPRSRA
jgi:hypothetical protein